MQYDAPKANLRQVANDQGSRFCTFRTGIILRSNFALPGTEEQHHDRFRLRSKVCRFLNAAAIQVPPWQVFARYRRAVVRTCFVPQWD
jgi:hypothetical protein